MRAAILAAYGTGGGIDGRAKMSLTAIGSESLTKRSISSSSHMSNSAFNSANDGQWKGEESSSSAKRTRLMSILNGFFGINSSMEAKLYASSLIGLCNWPKRESGPSNGRRMESIEEGLGSNELSEICRWLRI
jgi:hypothetical protein